MAVADCDNRLDDIEKHNLYSSRINYKSANCNVVLLLFRLLYIVSGEERKGVRGGSIQPEDNYKLATIQLVGIIKIRQYIFSSFSLGHDELL